MTYVALKEQEVNGARRRIGDLVPEADSWPNINSYVRRGFITFVPDGEENFVVERLRRNDPTLHISPMARPAHIKAAARRLNYGDASVADANIPLAEAADASPSTPSKHPAVQAPARKKKG